MKNNKTVTRTIDILIHMANAKKSLTLTEISTALNIPKSSTLDIIQALLEKEVIEIDNPISKTYKLGIVMFTLGSASVSRTNLQVEAHGPMTELSLKTKKTVFLAVPKHEKVVYVSKIEGSSAMQSSCAIGDTNPMYLTGIGKAILAGMTDAEVYALYGDGEYLKRTPQTLANYADLIADLNKTRERGYAIDDREGVEFLYCFGAPIYDYTNKVIAAISIVSIVDEVRAEEKICYPQLITQTAMEISRKFGFTGSKFYNREEY
ncbi:MAG: IclR family transcriptional regulator [Defluviitaleaceae bacterium]|nr:IclR family transcriptional regulator [Defluviitaleaceae bacterium]